MTFDEVIYDFAAFIALWSVKYNFNIVYIFFKINYFIFNKI